MDRVKIPLPVISRITIILIFLLLSYFILVEFRTYLYPLTLGVLFAYLLYPVAGFLESRGMPRILANLISILFGLGAVYGTLFFIYKQMGVFLQDIPGMKSQASQNIDVILTEMEGVFGISAADLKIRLKEMLQNFLHQGETNLSRTFSATFNTLFAIFIMPVYVFFFLFYRDKFRNFILMLIPTENKKNAHAIIDNINNVGIRYISGVTLVVIILIVLNTTGFLIIGLEHAVLLGVIAALLNFIPYFGTIMGYSIPFLVAFLTESSPEMALAVFLQFIIVQFTENNILTPNIVGGILKVNPFGIILGVTFGGVIWGIPGMFVVVPVLAMIKVLCDHIERLRPLGYLIGVKGVEDHAVNLTSLRKRFLFKKNR